jgi:hypothetical protein
MFDLQTNFVVLNDLFFVSTIIYDRFKQTQNITAEMDVTTYALFAFNDCKYENDKVAEDRERQNKQKSKVAWITQKYSANSGLDWPLMLLFSTGRSSVLFRFFICNSGF